MQEGAEKLLKVISKSILSAFSVLISGSWEQQAVGWSLPTDWYQPAWGDQNRLNPAKETEICCCSYGEKAQEVSMLLILS